MKTPFTNEQFFSVFENYNIAVFPVQIIFLILGILALYLVLAPGHHGDRFTGGLLGFLWIWMGGIYHMAFFSTINPAAFVFGSFFLIQGFLFIMVSFNSHRHLFDYSGGFWPNLALFFILFGLLVYPAISFLSHDSLIHIISFGLPCPTTIVTFGFMMLGARAMPRYLLIIPVLWSLIGTSAALNFGVYQDFILTASALLAVFYIYRKRSRQKLLYTASGH